MGASFKDKALTFRAFILLSPVFLEAVPRNHFRNVTIRLAQSKSASSRKMVFPRVTSANNNFPPIGSPGFSRLTVRT